MTDSVKTPTTNIPFLCLTHNPDWWSGAAATRREFARQARAAYNDQEERDHLKAALEHERTMKILTTNLNS